MWAAQYAMPHTPYTLCVEPLTNEAIRCRIGIQGFHSVGSMSLSPDGQWVAFNAVPKDGHIPHCIIVGRDGKELRKLCLGCGPRWSRDGKQLLFMREPRYHKGDEAGIFVIQRSGGGERRLGDGRWPDWSPDGKQITFSKGGNVDNGGAAPGAKVFVASVAGSNPRYVAEGDYPCWSPDGKRIACCDRNADQGHLIRIVTIATGQAVIAGKGWLRAEWSADGKSLVCNGYVEDEAKFGMIRLSAEAAHRPEALFREFPGAFDPCPSLDGGTIAFVIKRSPVRTALE
jgi:Tol biopolymer transport system component